MPANITPSGDYYFNLDIANTMYVGGDLSVAGNITTPVGPLAANTINNGTSNVNIAAAAGNVTVAVANASGNVATFTNTGLIITGDLTVSGNATLSGNISGDHIDNGTTAIDILVPNGNANITVGGVSNIAVFATTGLYVTGVISATSNVVANNVLATTIVNGASVTGTTVSATANVTGGNIITGGLITATGNIQGGNVATGGQVSATANITGGNVQTAGLITATGNVTGGNLLTGGLVNATANITGGNVLTPGQVSATGNVTGGNVNTGTVRNGSGSLALSTGSGDLNLNPAGNVVVNNTYINGVAQPVQDNDAASKIYVDNAVSTQLTYHQPVAAATTGNLATATSGTISYAQPNGAGNGVGATLTTTGTFYLIDTANIQTVGTRVLIKDEGNAVFNGVYTYANTTTIVRSTDADEYGSGSATSFGLNDYFFVQSGNVNAGAAFVVSAPTGAITFGTSNIEFSQFSSSQTYSANTSAGISLNGTVINAKVDNDTTAFDGGGNISVKPSANLTTPNIGVASGTSVSVTGNVTGGNLFTGGAVSATGTITSAANVSGAFFLGNGSQLTGIAVAGSTGGMIISGTSNVRVADSANTTIGYQGNTVAEFAGTGAYITGILSSTGNVSAPYFVGNGAALTGISSNKIYYGTSEANIGAANGNANITIGGVSNVAVFTTDGLVITGTVSATSNVLPGNLVTAGLVTATGNVTGGNLLSAGLASVAGNILGGNLLTGALVSATTMVAAGNVTGGNLLTGGLISATGAITAAANITGGNLITAGQVTATGNISGNYILGNGALLTGVITSVANINNGTSNITVVSSGGNITVGVGGTSNVAVFASTGEYVTGVISATGNVTGGNLLTAGLISATGNIQGGNILTGGSVSATGAINAFSVAATYGGFGTTVDSVYDTVAAPRAVIAAASDSNTTINSSTAALAIVNNGTTTNNWAQLNFAAVTGASTNQYSSGIIAVQFGARTNAQYPTGIMTFSTSTSLNSAPSEKVRIDNNGNVGIANTTPNTTLGVTGTGWFSGNITGGNLLTAGLISATSTITAAANITGGNLLTAGLISATSTITAAANITGGNVLTAGLISATSTITSAANITGGNLLTGGLISATGNILTSGNVGIGQTSQVWDEKLGVRLAASGVGLGVYYASGGYTSSCIRVQTETSGSGWKMYEGRATGGSTLFWVDGSGGAYFAGNVGIANTSPTTTLGVTGTGYFSANITGGNLLTGGLISATSTITAAANITGGNLLTAGLISATGNITGGNINTAGVLLVNTGNAAQAITNGAANGVGNIGSATTYFNTVYAKATSAQYADLAEFYRADADYLPGTVVSFGGDQEVTRSQIAADNTVAGVISTNASYMMNSALSSPHRALVALTGRVPTLVTGPVRKGAMMVSAGDGRAQACATPAIGTVIGKALQDFDGESGMIEVVVGRV